MELEKAGECHEHLSAVVQAGSRATSCASATRTASSTRCWPPSGSPIEDLARAAVGRRARGAAVDPEDHLPRRRGQRRAPRGVARERCPRRRDRDKEATRELTKLVRSRLGLELPETAELAKLRAITLALRARWASSERSVVRGACDSTASQRRKTKDEEEAVRELARRLRDELLRRRTRPRRSRRGGAGASARQVAGRGARARSTRSGSRSARS